MHCTGSGNTINNQTCFINKHEICLVCLLFLVMNKIHILSCLFVSIEPEHLAGSTEFAQYPLAESVVFYRVR